LIKQTKAKIKHAPRLTLFNKRTGHVPRVSPRHVPTFLNYKTSRGRDVSVRNGPFLKWPWRKIKFYIARTLYLYFVSHRGL